MRAVLFRGSGQEAFASGADISEFKENRKDRESAMTYNKIVEEAEVEGTICDCGEILLPGGAFPKWPLLFLAAVPLVFINDCDDCVQTPESTPTPTPPPPTATPTPTPEPASLLLFGTGLVAVGAGLRRRRRNRIS